MNNAPLRSARKLRGVVLSAVAALVVAPLAATLPAAAATGGTGLVITEVYGGGGNSGATYKSDFIELYNPTGTAIAVDGMSVQYISAAPGPSTTAQVTPLTGSVPAHGHYLVKEATGAGGTEDLPAPDATGTIAMAGTAFTAWLAKGTTAVKPAAGSVVDNPDIVDLVGVNSASFEAAPAAAITNTTSANRNAQGVDTDDNSKDFTSAAPTPSPSGETGTEEGGVVISEVYGGGGLTGAKYMQDFVELYNPTGAAVSLDGMSVQYLPSTGGTARVTPLAGSVPSHAHFLVREAGGPGGTTPLPIADATGTVDISGNASTVWLAGGTAPVRLPGGSIVGNPDVEDLVGAGTTRYETQAAQPTNNAVSTNRDANGTDTDDNSKDFSNAAPSPVNADGDSEPPTEHTIEEIQGEGDTSPFAGKSVVTDGVVTAAYPTGGLNGFYLQAAGTGGSVDLGTHKASDAVFVYLGTLPTTAYPTVGDHVSVTGKVTEFGGLTELSVGRASAVAPDGDAAEAPTAAKVGLPREMSQRESLEGMLLAPQGPFTVTDNYALNQYAEIALAAGSTPLRTPTDVAKPSTPKAVAVAADNAARAVTLDDAATTNFLSTGKDTPLPWLTLDKPVRVGAPVTFTKPVVLDFRNDTWKFQPTTQLTAANAGTVQPATFVNTRTAKPDYVGGGLKVASFNVLNYFNETGVDYVSDGGTCSSYKDRAGNPITVNTCNGDGPRGAWDDANKARQQDKIVKAINTLGADVLSLEEIENSAKYGGPAGRDAALANLVAALNADAGSDVWTYVPSPPQDQRPTVAEEDVIRTAFIYKNAKVEPVGDSHILTGSAAFVNAREPLAQVFKPKGGTAAEQFLTVVNHFKSKGSGEGDDADQGDGQGASNASRVAQAHALVKFVNGLKASTATSRVFLTGDFNSYTKEDPMRVLYHNGFTDIGSKFAHEYTYVFDGSVGSLDHVLANDAALGTVKGAAVWNINSVESVAYEYSRYNYNATNFYAPTPYRSSDHDPLLVGFDPAALGPDSVQLNLLGINDFHGRIDANTTAFATTVERLRLGGGAGKTLFLSAGDNVGASLFESASAEDNPTIDVLNKLGLQASAVGNHEFDKGLTDLTGHLTDRADWEYLGANVYKKGTTTPALPEYKTFDVGGVTVGVIGAITQEAPSLVSPDGISTLDFGDPVAAVNRVTDRLTDGNDANGEADVIVAELHEGASEGTPEGATLEEEVAAGGAFAHIVTDTSPKVAAIFTGHTHKEYSWDAPVPGAAGRTRPIIQTGDYGNNVGQVELTVNKSTGAVESYTSRNVPRAATADLGFSKVRAVKKIVDAAVAAAAIKGAVKVGELTADITTAYSGGSYVAGKYVGPNPADPKVGRDDRSSESTLGNTVADALVETLAPPEKGGAEIGVANPGGLREELLFKGAPGSDTNGDGVITYAEANSVLPFVNNLWSLSLTGAQFKQVLEQQWQTKADGSPVTDRPFLHLGLSGNVSTTLDPGKPAGQRVTSVHVDGKPLDPAKSYRIATFSFLATGGDNFRAFTQGTDVRDSGLVDRDGWIAYLGKHSPNAPKFDRRQVYGSGVPASIKAGTAVSFTLSRLDLTSLGSPANTTADVALRTPSGDTPVTSVPVSNGSATIAFTAPAAVPAGSTYVITAHPSGTTVMIPAAAGTTTPPPPPPPPGKGTPTVAPRVYPNPVKVHRAWHIGVALAAPGGYTAGYVSVYEGRTRIGRAKVASSRALVPVARRYAHRSTHRIRVFFEGNAKTLSRSVYVSFNVR